MNFTDKQSDRTSSAFTLFEMLAVLAVMAILLGVAIPSFRGLSSGPSLSSASMKVRSAVEEARATALSMSNYVGVFIVENTGNQEDELAKFALFEVADLSDGATYEMLKPPNQISSWQMLPLGTIFMKGDQKNLPSILDLPLTSSYFGIRGIDGTGFGSFKVRLDTSQELNTHLRGIIFGPNGSVVAPRLDSQVRHLDIPVIEGFPEGQQGNWTAGVPNDMDQRRFDVVRIGRLSGSVRILRQEEYSK